MLLHSISLQPFIHVVTQSFVHSTVLAATAVQQLLQLSRDLEQKKNPTLYFCFSPSGNDFPGSQHAITQIYRGTSGDRFNVIPHISGKDRKEMIAQITEILFDDASCRLLTILFCGEDASDSHPATQLIVAVS